MYLCLLLSNSQVWEWRGHNKVVKQLYLCLLLSNSQVWEWRGHNTHIILFSCRGYLFFGRTRNCYRVSREGKRKGLCACTFVLLLWFLFAKVLDTWAHTLVEFVKKKKDVFNPFFLYCIVCFVLCVVFQVKRWYINA